jgi:hypothetical protein
MKNLPEEGIKTPILGVNSLIFKDHIEIYHDKMILRIPFAFSKVNYGNFRYWMRCPNPTCGRRCRKLYLCPPCNGISIYICRTCLKLAYRSQNKTALDRVIDKKWNLIHRLGCSETSIMNSQKPKWMHWKTFDALRDNIEELDIRATLRIADKFS